MRRSRRHPPLRRRRRRDPVALLTITGAGTPPANVIRATIFLPRVGVWHADLTVDASTALTGTVTIATADGSFSLTGTVQRDGVFQQTLSMRIVGGAGGLADFTKTVPPKAFQNVALQLPLTYVLASVGESLAPAGVAPGQSDPGVLATFLRFWCVTKGTATQALQRLLDPIATSWRVLPNGQVWVGTDTFPSAPNVQFDVLERHFSEGRIVIGCEEPFLLPGTSLTLSASATQGVQPVSYVVHEVHAESVRTEAWFGTGGM